MVSKLWFRDKEGGIGIGIVTQCIAVSLHSLSPQQPAYVLQIFPPCEFSESHLSRLAPDLLASISNISPHLMIVIASV